MSSDAARAALSGKVSFDGDRLHFSDLDSAPFSRLRKTHMSPSTMAGVGRTGCPSRWAIEQVLRELTGPGDPFGAAELGTSAHALLEDLFGLPAEDRDKAHAAHLLTGLHQRHDDLVVPSDDLTMGLWRAKVSEHMIGLFDIEDPRDVLAVAREQDMTGANIDGVPATGFIDRTELVRDEHGAILGIGVDDYKTGKVKRTFRGSKLPDDHGEQLRLYALMEQSMDGVIPVRARVLYTKHGQAREVSLSRQALGKTRKNFTAAWSDLSGYLDEGAFPTRTSPLCGWCPLSLVCPSAEREGLNVPRCEQAKVGPHLGVTSLPWPTATGSQESDVADDEDQSTRPSNSDDPPLNDDTGVIDMNGNLHDGKPWEETVGDGLNPTSYAAMAAFGMTELAVDSLHEHGQKITGTTVKSMAQTLAWIVGRSQANLTGTNSLQDGSNTRIRGALRTTLKTLPPPFGQDAQAWEQWAIRVSARCDSIAAAAVDLWATGPVAQPWAGVAQATDASGHANAA